MSKRKKSYNKISDDGSYDSHKRDVNGIYTDYNNTYQDIFPNNVRDILENNINLNGIFNLLNSMDLKKLSNILALISNGYDINNFDVQIKNTESYSSEIIINFFTSLRPILGNEFREVVDRFVQFYIDDVNKEK